MRWLALGLVFFMTACQPAVPAFEGTPWVALGPPSDIDGGTTSDAGHVTSAQVHGVVEVESPSAEFEVLQVSAIDPAFIAGDVGSAELLALLQNGTRQVTQSSVHEYPYEINDLSPGNYFAVASLVGASRFGISLNFTANPLRMLSVKEGQTSVVNFAFGPVSVLGEVDMSTQLESSGAFGVVALRAFSLGAGISGVVLPTIFEAIPSTGSLKGRFLATSLRNHAVYSIRVFTGNNAFGDALMWAFNPLSPLPPHAQVTTTDAQIKTVVTIP